MVFTRFCWGKTSKITTTELGRHGIYTILLGKNIKDYDDIARKAIIIGYGTSPGHVWAESYMLVDWDYGLNPRGSEPEVIFSRDVRSRGSCKFLVHDLNRGDIPSRDVRSWGSCKFLVHDLNTITDGVRFSDVRRA